MTSLTIEPTFIFLDDVTDVVGDTCDYNWLTVNTNLDSNDLRCVEEEEEEEVGGGGGGGGTYEYTINETTSETSVIDTTEYISDEIKKSRLMTRLIIWGIVLFVIIVLIAIVDFMRRERKFSILLEIAIIQLLVIGIALAGWFIQQSILAENNQIQIGNYMITPTVLILILGIISLFILIVSFIYELTVKRQKSE